MTRYHITLPDRIPVNLFNNTTARDHSFLMQKLRTRYAPVSKDSYSDGTTPIDALSNLFFRQVRDDISAKTLTKMFRPVVDEYVALDAREAPREPVQPAQPAVEPREEPAQGQLDLGLM